MPDTLKENQVKKFFFFVKIKLLFVIYGLSIVYATVSKFKNIFKKKLYKILSHNVNNILKHSFILIEQNTLISDYNNAFKKKHYIF